MVLAQPEWAARDQRHAQERPPRLVIVVEGPESVLSDVLAIHTLEMIPKSMIYRIAILHRIRIRGRIGHLNVQV